MDQFETVKYINLVIIIKSLYEYLFIKNHDDVKYTT